MNAIQNTARPPAIPQSDPCDFRHHTAGLKTGYQLEPCPVQIREGQSCCPHNDINGNLGIRAALDFLLDKSIISAQHNFDLRVVLERSQMRAFQYDLNVNAMVTLYILQEKTGPVTKMDARLAREREPSLRKELALGPDDPFTEEGIFAYAKRSKAKANEPFNRISDLINRLMLSSDAQGIETLALSAKKRIGTLLRQFKDDLASKAFDPLTSPWFQRATIR